MKVYRLADKDTMVDSRLVGAVTIALAVIFAVIGLVPLIYVLLTDSDAVSGGNYQNVRYAPQYGRSVPGGRYR